ncbi:MAG TPA: glycosyltransferase [Vicinamibacterales bacterium]|nr:glycosyltransferase [Vicinamibacterales bacterium]
MTHPRTAGKFIEIEGARFLIKGASYGTFAPSDDNGHFPPLEQVRSDFELMARSGFNTVRTYTVPSLALLDEAARHGLRVMIGLPWSQHVAFLDDARLTRDIRREIAAHVKMLGSHPATLLFAVGNEIPPSVVRWHGRRRVTRFLEDLCADARSASPQSLLSYVNYPPTEYLELDCFDVCAFNVYLHREADLRAYLARLQQIAGTRPLLLAEAGADSIREGTDGQAAITAMHIRAAFEEGLCGALAFSWTDEWWRGGSQIDDWAFGLVDADRRPKPALAAVSAAFASAPFPEVRTQTWPRVSVVVCAYNAADTLDDCLDSLGRLSYPDFEVIVVNDGSRDATGDIARRYPVRLIEVPNGGLSAARNIGLSAATGEIVAYTDADVRVDQDWLTYLVQPFLTSDVVGSGGPNVVPPDDPFVAQCVARAPGGPTQVLLDDRIAEHVPGCNMAFRREALLAIDGFNPVYLRAGDDVDICWRLQAKKQRIGFAPSALVWHHHRPSIKAYWRQQVGYGEGEAWLDAHHPEKFVHGTMLWHGRIYSPLPFIRSLSQRRVNSGVWGTAPFPSVYSTSVHPAQLLPHSPAWQALSTLALIGGAAAFTTSYVGLTVVLLLAGVLGWITTIARCLMFGWRSDLVGVASVNGASSRVAHRLLIAYLHFLQPLARFAGRIRGKYSPPETIDPARAIRLTWKAPIARLSDVLASARLLIGGAPQERFWSETWTSSDALLTELAGLLRAARPARAVQVDDGFRADRDLSVSVGKWGWLDVRSLIEEHSGARCLLRIGLRLRPTMLGVVLALSLLVALLIARTIVPVGWPWGSIGFAVAAALLVGRAARQTTLAVSATRAAVERAAFTVGMTPIRLRTRPRPRRSFTPRLASFAQPALAVALLLLIADVVDNGAALLRDPGQLPITSPIAAVTAADASPLFTRMPQIAGDIVVASNGDLLFADARSGVIHHFAKASLNDPAGVAAVSSDPDDQDDQRVLSSDWRVNSPTALAIGPDGNLYVADARSNRINRINDSGEMVTLAGTGEPAFDGDLKPAATAALNTPNGIAVAANGNIYIADSGNNRIRMVSAATGLIHTIAGTGEAGSPDADDIALGDGGPAKDARLNTPMDVAVAPGGDIYIADMGHHRVRMIDGVTGMITTIAGDGVPRSSGDGGPARGASLAGPVALALSTSKRQVTVFVAEYLGGNVRAITRGGSISTVRAIGRFRAPSRLEYVRGGWLYVVDDKGAVTLVNTSRGHAVQVAAAMTRGQRPEVVLPVTGAPIR